MKKFLAVLLILGLASGMAVSQKKKKNDKGEEPAKEEPKKEATVADKVKSSSKIDGLFTVYQDTVSGSVQLYIKKGQLETEFIYQSFSMGGPAELFLNQNMIRTTWLFSIRQSYDKIEFIRSNTNYYYDPSNAISKSAEVDVSESVFYSVKPEAKDDGGYLIKADDLFLSQKLDQVMPNVSGPAAQQILDLGSLKSDKSTYLNLRSYPNNTDFLVNLAFENPKPKVFGGADITDARYINVRMQHSFLEVPKNNFKPRFDDPRVGYFTEQKQDMTTYSSTPYKDVINRWNLVKKDPNAALSEPVEPITWWVENTTPVEWRQTILDAGNKWNIAFEAAGFKNAVVMKMMPDDAEWDPADIRYNVIRWVSSDLGYAIGPSFVNPRTGQILGADITIDFGIMSGATNTSDIYNSFVNPPQENQMNQCTIGSILKMQFEYSNAVLEANEVSDNGLEDMRHQFMTFLILHEMGHTMGLNHNMKASTVLSPAQLKDQAITRQQGVVGSVMDYPAPNVILQDAPVDYYTTTVGPYDKWAIEFGYAQFNSNEEASIKKILSRSHQGELTFGNDADILSPFGGVDPRVRTWDMSSDMVAYAESQYKTVNTTMGKMKDKFVKEGQSYHNLRSKYGSLRSQRLGMTMGVVGYIGGIYVDRSFPEQNSGSNPLTPVAADYQRKAMQLLNKYVLAPDAFNADATLFPYLQMQRRGFNFFGSTEDPNLQVYAQQLHNIVFTSVLSNNTLTRINNTSLYGNNYSVTQVMNDLVNGVFDADLSSSVNLYRRNAQVDLVQKLATILGPESRYDHSSKASAHSSLTSIKGKLQRATSVGDEVTKAHRKYLIYLIDESMKTE